MLYKQQVDIIIPVHNSEKYLSDCLKSIDNQEYNKINVIIINDGSIDESEKIVNSYVHSSRFNVKYFAFQEPQGVSVARNKGIDEPRQDISSQYDGKRFSFSSIYFKE